MATLSERITALRHAGYQLPEIAAILNVTPADVHGHELDPTSPDPASPDSVGSSSPIDGGDAAASGTVVQLRRDTAANWTAENPILADGEFGLEEVTGKTKIGDGVTAWNDRDYYFVGGYTYDDADEIVIPGTTPGFGYGANWNSAGTRLIRYGRDVVMLMERPPYWIAPPGATLADLTAGPVLTFPTRWLPGSGATDSAGFYDSCYDMWSVPGAGRQRVSGFLLVDGEDWDLDQNFHWLEGSLAMCRASTYAGYTVSGLYPWAIQYAGVHDAPPPVPYFIQLVAQSRVEFRLPPDATLT